MAWHVERSLRTHSRPAHKGQPDVSGTTLGVLRHQLEALLSLAELTGSDSAAAALAEMALRHVEALQDQGCTTLPWRVGLFGRAHITQRRLPYLHPDSRGAVKFLDLDTGRREKAAPPAMCYGRPVDIEADLTTDGEAALLLYDHGACARVPPYHTGSIRDLGCAWRAPRDLRLAQ
jgi:hypothetical protein